MKILLLALIVVVGSVMINNSVIKVVDEKPVVRWVHQINNEKHQILIDIQ